MKRCGRAYNRNNSDKIELTSAADLPASKEGLGAVAVALVAAKLFHNCAPKVLAELLPFDADEPLLLSLMICGEKEG